jgi:hypothetical protein
MKKTGSKKSRDTVPLRSARNVRLAFGSKVLNKITLLNACKSPGGQQKLRHLEDRSIPMTSMTWRTGAFQSLGGLEHESHLEDRRNLVSCRIGAFQSPG